MLEKTFDTANGSIRYWVSPRVGSPFQLVFLPGLTADHRLFEKQLERFEEHVTCLAWDPPSHGLSRPFALEWIMNVLARILNELLQHEGFTRPVLVGQSMGGYVSQAYIDLYPGETAGFISIDSCPLQRSYYTSLELWALKHTRGIYAAFPWKLLVSIGSDGVATSEYGRALMREMMISYDKREYVDLAAWGYRVLADAVEKNRPYELDCPTLLICGERDAAGSAKRYNQAWEKRTGLPMERIEGAGHNSNTDAPEHINALIERFLEEHIR